MPSYSYRCRDCDHVFDIRQRMTDDPLEECPKCGGFVRRVINSVGVVFKGKGFYVTDNRRGATLPSSGGNASDAGTDSATPPKESPAATPETPKTNLADKPA